MRGDWAVLFSHAEDFAPCHLEGDRWTVIMARALSSKGIRLLTLASSPVVKLEYSWVHTVTGDEDDLVLADDTSLASSSRDLPIHRFFSQMRALSGARFVMIIDDVLSPCRTFIYDLCVSLPSPLEFVGWAHALRGKQARRGSVGDAPA